MLSLRYQSMFSATVTLSPYHQRYPNPGVKPVRQGGHFSSAKHMRYPTSWSLYGCRYSEIRPPLLCKLISNIVSQLTAEQVASPLRCNSSAATADSSSLVETYKRSQVFSNLIDLLANHSTSTINHYAMGIPDEQIHPVATGEAAKTVTTHQQIQELIFYAGWVRSIIKLPPQILRLTIILQFCPFVQRTWITLEERGIPYQYKEVNPYKKAKHFLGTSYLAQFPFNDC